MKFSKVKTVSRLPKLNGQHSVLLYDARLEKKHGAWIRKFPMRIQLQSGEKLKALSSFPAQMEKILALVQDVGRQDLQVVAFGGGSVGDFAGFVASVLRRGVRLVQVPSTWLAAMDSAHGGKTALNVGLYKNQIGTFYPAETVYLVREVLLLQPPERTAEAAGEYYKTWFLTPRAAKLPAADRLTNQNLWGDLPRLVQTKWQVVRQDPYETKGRRILLNLGHTVGHVFEAALGLPHGVAVHMGLRFAIEWSKERGLWKSPELPEAQLPSAQTISQALRQISQPAKWLLRDKKLTHKNKIQFVFLRKPGYPVVQTVKLQELVNEWKRQSK